MLLPVVMMPVPVPALLVLLLPRSCRFHADAEAEACADDARARFTQSHSRLYSFLIVSFIVATSSRFYILCHVCCDHL